VGSCTLAPVSQHTTHALDHHHHALHEADAIPVAPNHASHVVVGHESAPPAPRVARQGGVGVGGGVGGGVGVGGGASMQNHHAFAVQSHPLQRQHLLLQLLLAAA